MAEIKLDVNDITLGSKRKFNGDIIEELKKLILSLINKNKEEVPNR